MDLSHHSLVRVQKQLEAAGLRTPLRETDCTAPANGGRIKLKPENLQPTGSFKIRGASNAISALSPDQRARGVVAYSTGNHAQAVAMAAREARVAATIVMSPDVPRYKLEATRSFGAEILLADPTSEARRHLAERYAVEKGLALIPPYDDYAVMAGQASIGIEIAADCVAAAVLVPIGGGGLISGIAAAIKAASPSTKVIGVEPEPENDAYLSFRSGKRIALAAPSDSIADAVKVQIVGEKTFPLIQQYVDDIVLVSEAEIMTAMVFAERHTGGSVEPAGALAVAAALYGAWQSSEGDVIAVVSGGNIDAERRATLALKYGNAGR